LSDTVFHLAGIVAIMPRMEKVLQRVNVGGCGWRRCLTE